VVQKVASSGGIKPWTLCLCAKHIYTHVLKLVISTSFHSYHSTKIIPLASYINMHANGYIHKLYDCIIVEVLVSLALCYVNN